MGGTGNADNPSTFPEVLAVLVPLDLSSNLGTQLEV